MTAPLIIVGSGMAGLGLARQVRARDTARPIVLITADSGDDYAKPLLSTGFAKGLPPARLATRSALEAADQLGVVMRTHTRVEGIDREARELHIGDERLPWSELVLATGAAPAVPFKIPDTVAGRAFTINDLDDYRRFHAALEALGRRARVAIVGAGLVGCEFANDLIAGGHEITLVAPESAPLPRLLPEPLGRALGEAFVEAGMTLALGRSLEALESVGSAIGIMLSGGSRLEADLVLVATGLRPRVELAAAAGLETGAAGILVNRRLETSAPGIYALGDVACVDGVNAMYVQPLQASAKALAQTLTGEPSEVAYGAWPILVKTSLLPVVAMPPTRSPARWRIEGEGRDLAAFAETQDERLIGFALTGSCVRRKVELARATPPLLG
ncbi:FAD-dependent oxidoreductase [Halomonas chromatireducens]|uniref:Rubredoxin-NAD(+) reductase n=1 Tax=Halomonas chromatireducens TaxID=507626 RepID=A0A120JW62_9GAMM|nr:FAD-dependent oxidoreductase [Halomonas chromatireducens]AMD01344.1 Rubredoxin-NAD(+) reductase [Halomonas chromatireducens]